MINFILCDDNIDVLNKLSFMLNSIFMQNQLEAHIAYSTTSSTDFLQYINENKADVVILDINLHSKSNGLDLANEIRKKNKNCYILFTTAYPEYVFLAYKFKTFDYLCKPISKERLEETILRLFDDILNDTSKKQYIKLDNKNTIIDQNEIQFIKRDGMKIIFHTTYRDYEVYSSFAKLQSQLPSNFIRCHKSFIANINNIVKLEPSSNLVYFSNNNSCDIGPKYKQDFMKGVHNYGDIN